MRDNALRDSLIMTVDKPASEDEVRLAELLFSADGTVDLTGRVYTVNVGHYHLRSGNDAHIIVNGEHYFPIRADYGDDVAWKHDYPIHTELADYEYITMDSVYGSVNATSFIVALRTVETAVIIGPLSRAEILPVMMASVRDVIHQRMTDLRLSDNERDNWVLPLNNQVFQRDRVTRGLSRGIHTLLITLAGLTVKPVPSNIPFRVAWEDYASEIPVFNESMFESIAPAQETEIWYYGPVYESNATSDNVRDVNLRLP